LKPGGRSLEEPHSFFKLREASLLTACQSIYAQRGTYNPGSTMSERELEVRLGKWRGVLHTTLLGEQQGGFAAPSRDDWAVNSAFVGTTTCLEKISERLARPPLAATEPATLFEKRRTLIWRDLTFE
jgi:hypothetical protein